MRHSHGRPRERTSRARQARRLGLVLVLVVVYMAAEAVGGILAGSLALLADAGHMLADAASLGLALFALWAAGLPATPRHTYGFYRTEILAALASGAALVAISVFIFIEALERLGSVPDVQGPVVMAIAAGGLIVNLAGLGILRGSRPESLNLEGAWLHLLADALGSVGAFVAGALVWMFGWNWADPAVSILIGLLVLVSAWRLLRETVSVLMEASPGHIDVDEVRGAIRDVPRVVDVHDLHVWTITSGKVALSAHLATAGDHPEPAVLRETADRLRRTFGIHHSTLQLESADGECPGGGYGCWDSEIAPAPAAGHVASAGGGD